ncbi:MAG: hypothetical protein ACOYMC_13565, partial [Pirellulales bacterium]
PRRRTSGTWQLPPDDGSLAEAVLTESTGNVLVVPEPATAALGGSVWWASACGPPGGGFFHARPSHKRATA